MASTSAAAAAADPCAICLGDMSRGQALFTAECSHTFHHNCISESAAHGNRDCPLCKATWRDVPALGPAPAPALAPPRRAYADDEETVAPSVVQADAAAGLAADLGEMALKTICEFSAVARDASHDSFAVLVHARAPEAAVEAADAERAPLDLVTVLDVSGSMQGGKLALVKQAMRFVIDNLRPVDRLSVVTFSNEATRVVRMARMTDDGKASAKRAVEALIADGGTNISEGLRVAATVLDDRRYRNAVTSIILLSDGQDNQSRVGRNFANLVPFSFRARGHRPAPMHTFGFGTDHDAAAMHTIAEVTGGTFAFVENQAVIQDSFAHCLGGLLSVAVQGARLAVACEHPGVRVREIKSGRYENHVAEDGRAASVDVGELYAGEERRFLLFVDVPSAEAAEEATHLIKVRCTYLDTATGRAAEVVGEDAVVQRPVEVINPEASVEVERERVRVAAADDIAAARAAAERGEHAEAGRMLQRRRQSVLRSAAGDPAYDALQEELEDLSARVEDESEYERTGRACMLTGMSAHFQQRGTLLAVRESSGYGRRTKLCARISEGQFTTKAARSMVKRSMLTSSRPIDGDDGSTEKKSPDQEQQQQQPTSSPPLKKTKGETEGAATAKSDH